jgi:serine phosphatase RsbU (regulator of sigma subunit)
MERVFGEARERPLQQVAQRLEDDVRDFARGVPFHDDRTLVILRRRLEAA